MRVRLILITILVGIGVTDAAIAQAPSRLNLGSIVDTYIQNNLDLEVARYKLERIKADQIAAKLRPNPGVTVTAENFAVSGPTPFSRLYEVGAVYTETIELGGKRALRRESAIATTTAAELQFEDTMRRGLAEVKRLYFDALLGRYSVEVATENRQTFEQLVRFNVTRFQEGAIPEVELIKVRLERLKFESAVKQAELSYKQSVIRLLEKLGSPTFANQEIVGELTYRQATLDLNSMREVALRERSDVRAATAEIAAASQRLELERSRAKPDISPFAGYKRVGSDNTIMFGVSIPLKVRDRNDGEISRAEADVKSAEVKLKFARNHALAEVEAAYAGVQAAREMVETFQNELLRQADESQAITLAAYEEGGSELLPVLDAQRTRSEVRQQYFKTLFDYEASMVALELAVGKEIQP